MMTTIASHFSNMQEQLSTPLQTALIFAARYAHSRATGAASAVVCAAKRHWKELSEGTQKQLIKESHEAIYNLDDWQDLRYFAESHKPV